MFSAGVCISGRKGSMDSRAVLTAADGAYICGTVFLRCSAGVFLYPEEHVNENIVWVMELSYQ
ncbi:hypothetical protein BLA28_15240 [Eisenbergiella tayi]|nr:hypothetical protein BLA28_15240 [Eisenbergiella tayi]